MTPYTNSIWYANSQDLYKQQQAWFSHSGTYTSQAINTTGNAGYGNLSWTATTPTNTTLTMKVRSDSNSDMSTATAWATCTTITSGNDISTNNCVTDNEQYIQYQATLGTTDGTVTPVLKDVTIGYSAYGSGTLTSSSYNSGDDTNIVNNITWTESGTGEIKYQIRTSANNSAWTDWLGPTGTGDYYTNPVTNTIHSSHRDGASDRYIQYKAFIEATNKGFTPTLSDINLTYLVNSAPDFETTPTAVQNSDGTFTISYSIRDVDSLTGNNDPGFSSVAFEYSINGGGWNNITSQYLASGDLDDKAVGESSYTEYTATWDPKSLLDGTYSSQAQIRISLDDNEIANNTSSATTANFAQDSKDPTLGSYPIAIDATISPAILTLDATDDSTLSMKISLNSDLSGASWEAYSSSTTLELDEDPETVYVQFRDSVNNSSAIRSATTPTQTATLDSEDFSNAKTPVWKIFLSWSITDVLDADFANYRIYYSTDDISYSLLFSENNKIRNFYLHKDLTEGQEYYYKMYVEKVDGTKSAYSATTSTTPSGQGGTDTANPTITDVASSNITTQSAVITWNTEELSDSTVGYSATAGVFDTEVVSLSMVDQANNYGPHEVTLTNLTPGVKYYYRVISSDPVGNQSIDNNGGDGYTFTTLSGPKITNVTTPAISNTKATITWATDLTANSSVFYSANSDLSNATEITIDESVTDHEINITDLTEGTKYYYYVQSGIGTA